jgi:hypothetical protein
MNTAVRNLTFLILSVMAFNHAVAQKASFTTNSGMMIGFGLGASYQQSDIANSRGVGLDFTLGHHIYKKENAFFSIDWKVRLLAGENKAYDHRINPDTTYNNIRLDVANCDLELGLTLNRLRERTRIVITGFAGAGMTYGRTFTDLYDSNGVAYDYSLINPNQGRAKIHADLVELSDGDFETPLVKKAALLPTLGIFIGYQFTPGFMLGIEHKTNFSLTEKNSFDGINIDNNIISGSKLDRIHYTTLSLRWNFQGRSSRSSGGYTYSSTNNTEPSNKFIDTTEPIPSPPPVRTVYPPVVDITVPAGTTYSTTEEKIDISAKVQNVTSRQDIKVILNGNNIGFEYNPGTGIIRSTLVLADGKNDLVITGSNQAGSSRDNVTINLNKPVRTALPVIKFINPPGPVTVDHNIFELSVQTVNVNAWQDVTVNINGNNITNFSLSTDGVVTTNIGLKEGSNRVEVTGKNESGSTKEHTTITYIKPVTKTRPVVETSPCLQPALRMIAPAQDDLITDNPSYTFRTEVKNIGSRDQLLLTLNSKTIAGFNFDGNELIYSASLNAGSNSFLLTAKNSCGVITIISTIIYRPAEPVTVKERPCQDPGLNFSVDAVNQNDATHELKGSVSNVKDRIGITMTINGMPYTGFQFIQNAGKLAARFKLNPGTNIIKVIARNECGQVSGSDTVIIKETRPITETRPVTDTKPCPTPALRMIAPAQNDLTTDNPSYIFRTEIKNISSKDQLLLTINSNTITSFNFDGNELTCTASLNAGTNSFVLTAKNSCGTVTVTSSIIYKPAEPVEEIVTPKEESPCGPRINPGNSSWQFCLITPTDTFNRESLTNSNFNYSGPASSLFIMPIAGGGDAIVNGKPYSLKPGQYYLFTGKLTVVVSTKNPGSMGQWSVCITSDKEPVYGNGSNRPKSPCEGTQDRNTQKKTDSSQDVKSSKDITPSRDSKKDTTKTGGKK